MEKEVSVKKTVKGGDNGTSFGKRSLCLKLRKMDNGTSLQPPLVMPKESTPLAS